MNNSLASFLNVQCITHRLRLLFLFVLAACALSCQNHTKNLQQSETRAEEIGVVSTLRTVVSAQRAYSLSNGGNFGTFPQLVEGGFLDSRFEGTEPQMHGYTFKMEVGEKKFSCEASPTQTTENSGRHYYVDSTSGLIRMNASRPATADDPPFQP